MQTTTVPDEERLDAADRDAFTALVDRLSRQSVTPGKHFDAYADVPWDDPEFAIDPDDPRFEPRNDPITETEWYRALPPGTRSRLGLALVASKMKIGLQFESVLKRGLLEFANQLPNNAAEYRYALHETIEEAHHSLMFQEFVNRSGVDVKGMPKLLEVGSRRVVTLGRRFPALFFLFVLGGEDPIDHVQRENLRSDRPIHPLLERIMRIHVTEEARHLSFARHYLKTNVPRLSRPARTWLALETPLILGTMDQLMLRPSRYVVKEFAIPDEVLREAYRDNPEYHAAVRASLRKVRQLARELGLITPVTKRMWKAFGIWDDDRTEANASS